MTKVLITQSAWQVICREVSFFAEQNKEAIVYPLFGFLRHDGCLKAPWEMLELGDIEYFIVTHAFAPPRDLCNHENMRAGFLFSSEGDELRWQEALDSWSRPLCQNYPTLEIGNVHSHQFARFTTWPSSGGDDTDYPRILDFWKQLTTRKLNTPLEIIICQSGLFSRRWKACCFGFDQEQNIVSLGSAEIVSDINSLVAKILSKPFYLTGDGLFWKLEQYRQVPEIESFDQYYFGWTSCKIRIGENDYLFVNLPPSFPNCRDILFQTLDAKAGKWSEMKRFEINGLDLRLAEVVRLAKQEEKKP